MAYVSRGALKLIHALDHFALSPAGMVALDLGASTGGFVEVLLARGAASVYAVDVGHGQLSSRLARDPRVIALERTDARSLSRGTIPNAPNFITADVSFIGLEKALPVALELAAPKATLVALIKPQFEVGPQGVGKGGLVKDAALGAASVRRIADWLSNRCWTVIGTSESPIAGGDGNLEYLIAATRER